MNTRNVRDILATSVLDILKFCSNKKNNGSQQKLNANMTNEIINASYTGNERNVK